MLLPGTYVALAAWQETQGPPGIETELRLARCRMASSPDQAEEIFHATLEHHRPTDPAATARWCLRTRGDIDWTTANPAYRAIRGIALAAAGRKAEAALLPDDFPWDELLPSEKRILRSLADSAS